MNKTQANNLLQETISDFIDTCPHCGAKAHFKMQYIDSHAERNRDMIYYVIFKCVPCKKLVLETARFKQNEFDPSENLNFQGWQDKFPTENIALVSKYEGIVPNDILEDFKEGIACMAGSSFRAAVAMFRRSLQSAMLNLGADAKLDLIDQIKNLSSLTPDIKDWAHNIRIFGNWGAHPQDDNLKDIDETKAQETQSFLEEFFNYVYVMPYRVSKARQPILQPETTETSD